MKMSRAIRLAASFAVAALFVMCWQLLADYRFINPVFLPGPDRAWNALVRGITAGDLGYGTSAMITSVEDRLLRRRARAR